MADINTIDRVVEEYLDDDDDVDYFYERDRRNEDTLANFVVGRLTVKMSAGELLESDFEEALRCLGLSREDIEGIAIAQSN